MSEKSLKRRFKKINLSTIFFFALSLISSTFAWFAYSNTVGSNMNIEVKSWDIEITENNTEISQVLNIDIDDFRPGIETYTKTVNITNNGDLDAALDFQIISLRILDDTYSVDNQDELLDEISHDYPFFFNFYETSTLIESSTVEKFKISIGWPLDSGNDVLDSTWGADAYDFYHNEQLELANNPAYEVRPCIELVIKLNTRQYVEDEDTNVSDTGYKPGQALLNGGNTVYVIDTNNKKSDTTVNVMNPVIVLGSVNAYSESSSSVEAADILRLVSTDIYNTKITKTGISDRILGNVTNSTRETAILNYLITNNASIVFDNTEFTFLKTSQNNINRCVWTGTEVDETRAFAIKNNSDSITSLYIENKSELCLSMTKTQITKE